MRVCTGYLDAIIFPGRVASHFSDPCWFPNTHCWIPSPNGHSRSFCSSVCFACCHDQRTRRINFWVDPMMMSLLVIGGVQSRVERLVHHLCGFVSTVGHSKSCDVRRFRLCGCAKVDLHKKIQWWPERMEMVQELHDESAWHSDWLSVQMRMGALVSWHLWRSTVKQLPWQQFWCLILYFDGTCNGWLGRGACGDNCCSPTIPCACTCWIVGIDGVVELIWRYVFQALF